MLAPIDVAIVVAFVAYCVFSGLRARKQASAGTDAYFLADRALPGWKAGISMAATQFSADTPLLVVGIIATAGIFGLWRLWIYALAFLLMGLVLGPAWRRARVLTDAELAEVRYGSRLGLVLRAAKALYFGTLFNCAVIAMVMFATARIAAPLLPWQQWLPADVFAAAMAIVESTGIAFGAADGGAEAATSGALSIAAVVGVTALYSTAGGLRAVVATDLVQFTIAIVATLAYAIVLVDHTGGLATLPDRIAAIHGDAFARHTLAFDPSAARDVDAVFMALIGVQWLAQMNADGTGYLAQRTMACKSDRDARQAALVFVVAQVLVRSLLWIPIGLALLVVYPEVASLADRESTYVDGMVGLLPAGIRGLMVVGMLAALASTIDSHLNWGSSYWTHDLYDRLVCRAWRRRVPGGRELVWVARLSNVGILIVAAVILGGIGSIQSAWHATLLLGAGMGVPLVLRWVWWRMSAAAELGAIAASLIAAPMLLAWVDHEAARVLAMAAITAVVTLAIAMLGQRAPDEATIAFFRRVRPPGMWGAVARGCGEDPRDPALRLRRGLLAVVVIAAAVFCALVGLGTWWFGGTAPQGIPRGPWIAALLVVAVGAAVWGRAAIARLDAAGESLS